VAGFDELSVILKVVLRRHQAAQLLPNNKVLIGNVLIIEKFFLENEKFRCLIAIPSKFESF